MSVLPLKMLMSVGMVGTIDAGTNASILLVPTSVFALRDYSVLL